jgi:hypothetical protein
MLKLDSYNAAVEDWSKSIVEESKSTASVMGVKHRNNSPSKSASLNKIKGRVGYRAGAAEKVSIRFPRNLIWTQKGAGKGAAGSKGSRWIDKFGNTKTTNPASIGKMGTGGRKAKPFFNTALDGANGVDKLATIAAQEIGAAITNNLFIQ